MMEKCGLLYCLTVFWNHLPINFRFIWHECWIQCLSQSCSAGFSLILSSAEYTCGFHSQTLYCNSSSLQPLPGGSPWGPASGIRSAAAVSEERVLIRLSSVRASADDLAISWTDRRIMNLIVRYSPRRAGTWRCQRGNPACCSDLSGTNSLQIYWPLFVLISRSHNTTSALFLGSNVA